MDMITNIRDMLKDYSGLFLEKEREPGMTQ